MSGLLAGVGAIAVPLVLLGSLAGHLRRPGLLGSALRAQRTLPAFLIRPVAVLVPAAEAVLGLAAATGLLLGRDDLLRGALGCTAVLLASYAAYSLHVTRTRPAAPCGCAGDLDSPMTIWVAVRAAALALPAAVGAFAALPSGGGAETAMTVLAGLTFAVLLWTLPRAMNEQTNQQLEMNEQMNEQMNQQLEGRTAA
ncbi:MauE/DoxX family redox-associated membrane protein [Actinomadura sp. 9N407]|uniref:MauE/DoxX family redox-associated membrane protein n=1 Tax=Actinomadura sp. 9N407 TaxID=3375154 RepID=UPI0037A596E4